MNQKTEQSTVGDWAFLLGGAALLGGYFIYENPALLQTLMTTPMVPSGGLVGWLIANWGLLLLVAAIIFAVTKFRGNRTTIAPSGALPYRSVNYVTVKVVR